MILFTREAQDAKMTKQPFIVGNPVLVVIDIQASTFIDASTERSIPNMAGYKNRMIAACGLVDTARAHDVPVIFIQEAHRPNLIDFGRELDGSETVHCLEGDPRTELAVEQLKITPADYTIKKRRYSAFFGTDLEILLKGLKAETLILCGGLTDVCVHYTFADAHQMDYYTRVVEDCVAGSGEQAHEASLRAMEYLQTGARCSLDETQKAFATRK
jgi:nicotinamidase-related amidase